MTETSNLHIAVVGGGPGGYAAAFLAADLGMKVTLIDPEANPGGVCLYRGCIPSKALLHVAKLIDESRHAKNWGIEYADPKIDLARLRSWKEGVVKKADRRPGRAFEAAQGRIHPGARGIREFEHAANFEGRRRRTKSDLRSHHPRDWFPSGHHSQPQTRHARASWIPPPLWI